MLLELSSVYEPQRKWKWKIPHSAKSEMLIVVDRSFVVRVQQDQKASIPAVSKTGTHDGKSWVCVKVIKLKLNLFYLNARKKAVTWGNV